MGGGLGGEKRRRPRERVLETFRRSALLSGCGAIAGGAFRFLFESAVEFLVEDSCVVCRRSRFQCEPPPVVAEPAALLLQPVVHRLLRGTLSIRNHPLCAACARDLVAARAAGVLGLRVGGRGIETGSGEVFGEPAPGSLVDADRATTGGEEPRSPGERAGARQVRILSPFMTTTPVLELVHLLKFGGCRGLARPMAGAMAWAVRRFAGTAGEAPVLVPVPMDERALRRRGFSHTGRLASELSADLGYPFADVLRKTARTRLQSKTPNRERADNVRDAFACDPRRGLPDGCPVLVVDDLVTTGATAAACGAALLEGGAGSVDVVCFGRAM